MPAARFADTFARAGALVRRGLAAHGLTVAGALLFTYLFWILVRPLTYTGINYDETFFLWGGWSLTKGLVPYRDFQDFKPPMVFLTNGLAVALFGVPHQRFAFFFSGLACVSCLALYLALVRRGAGRLLAFVAVTLVAHAWLNPGLHDSSLDDAESIGLSFYLLGVAALLWGGRRVGVANAIGGGLLAWAVLSKEPYALIVVPTWVVFGFAARDHDAAAPRWPVYARQTLTGVAIAAGAVFLYLALAGGLTGYVRILRAYGSFDDICVRIGIAKPLRGAAAFQDARERLGRKILTPGEMMVFVPFLAAFALGRRDRWATRVALVATVIASIYVVTLGRCFFKHYYVMMLAGFALWTALGARALGDLLAGAAGSLRRWAALTIAVLAFAHVGPRWAAERGRSYRPNPYIGYGSGIPPEVVDFVQAHSTPADTIFTDGSPGLYVFAGRRSATRESAFLDEFIALHPGRTDQERVAPIRKQLDARRPKIVYLDPTHAGRKRRHREALTLPFLREQGYRQVKDGLYVRPG